MEGCYLVRLSRKQNPYPLIRKIQANKYDGVGICYSGHDGSYQAIIFDVFSDSCRIFRFGQLKESGMVKDLDIFPLNLSQKEEQNLRLKLSQYIPQDNSNIFKDLENYFLGSIKKLGEDIVFELVTRDKVGQIQVVVSEISKETQIMDTLLDKIAGHSKNTQFRKQMEIIFRDLKQPEPVVNIKDLFEAYNKMDNYFDLSEINFQSRTIVVTTDNSFPVVTESGKIILTIDNPKFDALSGKQLDEIKNYLKSLVTTDGKFEPLYLKLEEEISERNMKAKQKKKEKGEERIIEIKEVKETKETKEKEKEKEIKEGKKEDHVSDGDKDDSEITY